MHNTLIIDPYYLSHNEPEPEYNDVLTANIEYNGTVAFYDNDYLATRVQWKNGERVFTGETDQDFLFEILMGVIDDFDPEDRKDFVQNAEIVFTVDLEQPNAEDFR